jgi:hypothetical protein
MQGKCVMFTRLVWAGALFFLLLPSVAGRETCDLSDLPCAQQGQKCNIHFKNLTGVAENTCYKAKSWPLARTVKVKAKDVNHNTLGNTLTILAGAKNTMNLSKTAKAEISHITVDEGTEYFRDTLLTCDEIKTVLKGSGKCKIYLHKTGGSALNPYGFVFFDCSGGDVCTD